MEQTTASKPFALYSNDKYFYLKSKKPFFSNESFIKINRLTSKISQLDQKQFTSQVYNNQHLRKEWLDLVMGIIIVNQQPYLAVVMDSQPVATLNDQKILCIKSTRFISFKHKYLYMVVDQSQNQKILQQIESNIIKNNFYYCLNTDITLTFQKYIQNKPTERKYFWNQHMLLIFVHYNLPNCWRIPVMQGYVKEIYSQNKYFSFYYCVISRRSKFMSGTRFNSRGVDANSNASNFVQTQQLFICHNLTFSHISVRGSVPIFWQQQQFGASIRYQKPDSQNLKVIQKHYDNLKKDYQGNIVTINLLSKIKSNQKQLKGRFQFYLYKALPEQPYIHFDLNQQIKNKEDTSKIIGKFIDSNIQHLSPQDNFLCMDRYNKKLYRQQTVVPRINCLDCIDRTNVIMSRISLKFIEQVQQYINSHTKMDEKKIKLNKQYYDAIIQIWALLGNRVSQIYCGTESVATHLTKQQNTSFFSFISQGFKSLGRYYNANVNDPFKQLSLQFLLGLKQEQSKTKYFDDNVIKYVLQQTKYCSYEQAVIYILSWNCNTVDPQKLTKKDKDKLLAFPSKQTDIVVICLQQMVELNSYNVLLGNNESIISNWRKVLEQQLNIIGAQNNKAYVYLTSYDMVGISTFVFVCGNLFNRINKHEWLQIKTGFKNNLGNKGSIMLFVQIDDTYITFANCHLAAGQNNQNQRLQDIQYIHNDALKQRSKRRLFDKSQYKFLIGDLNFRLDMKNQEVREILYTIEKEDTQNKLNKNQMEKYLFELYQKDQFYNNKTTGSLSLYKEFTILFLPTYKYVKRQKIYDTKRTPSWCDRILFHSLQASKLLKLKYQDVDCYQSDHKPICGAFKILIKKEDAQNKRRLLVQYMESKD